MFNWKIKDIPEFTFHRVYFYTRTYPTLFAYLKNNPTQQIHEIYILKNAFWSKNKKHIIMNNLLVEVSAIIMRCVSHPITDLFIREIKTNEEYIQELIDYGHSFSSAHFQIYSEIKPKIEELRILGTNA